MKKKITAFILLAIFGLSATAQNKKNIPPIHSKKSLSSFDLPLRIQGKQTPFIVPSQKAPILRDDSPIVALRDSIYYWNWDTLKNSWNSQPYGKTIAISYDANKNLTNETDQNWDGTAWVNDTRYTYTYNINNSKTAESQDAWTGAAWANDYQSISTYDANNNITKEASMTWSGTVWENMYQIVYSYDANNNNISTQNQVWKDTIWVDGSKSTYTYDVNNNQITYLYQDRSDTGWVNKGKYTFTYDANNNKIGAVSHSWDGKVWVDSGRVILTYDVENHLTNTLSQYWSNLEWKNENQSIYTYDANEELTSHLYQLWNGTKWMTYLQFTYTYDINGLMKSKAIKEWNKTNTMITSGDSTHYYIRTANGINKLAAQNEYISAYPNPTKNILTIENNAISKNAVISIYTLQGRLLMQQPIMVGKTEFNVNELAKGIYIVRLDSGERTSVVRFIKE